MAKRPSLAETMRQSSPTLFAGGRARGSEGRARTRDPAPPAEAKILAARPYFAATRAGKKKVTVALTPAAHKQLKSLAVEHETKSQALLIEAIRDLFTKYCKPAIE